jgi:site-specific recombinase XerD
MRQPDNLYQERRDGHWHLRYKGAELKVGVRQGRGSNTYRIDLSEKTVGVVPVLEAFLNDWRPKLPGAATSPYVFLTQYGNPYSQHSLYEELRTLVGMRSGCDLRFFPHLIRSIWTTQSINAGVPVTVTATMLGDRPHTVLQSYNEMNEELHQSEALKFMHKALGRTEHTT